MFNDDLSRMVIRARNKWRKSLTLDSELFVDESTGISNEGFISDSSSDIKPYNSNSDITYLPSTQKVNSEETYQP